MYVVKITNLNTGAVAYYDHVLMFVDKAKTFQTNVPEFRASASEVQNCVFEDRGKAFLLRDGLMEQKFEEDAAYGKTEDIKFEVVER